MNDPRFGRQRTALKNLIIEVAVGIADWELVPGKRQRLRLDAAVYRETFGRETDIADCFNYAEFQAFLVAFEAREHIDLLETIVAEILDFCFADPQVTAAEASVAKPDVFNGRGVPSVSVSVSREDWRARRAG